MRFRTRTATLCLLILALLGASRGKAILGLYEFIASSFDYFAWEPTCPD